METAGRHTEDLTLNTDIVQKLLVGFVRDETHNAGFRKGVLGLSGGIDSTIVAYLAAQALGPDNVLGVIMPYKSSNPGSKADAELVARQLGIRTEVVDITPMVDAYVQKANGVDQLRAGNVMARQRMIVLYDVSSREKALVLGTSNKTEIFLGYGTLYGDMACALNPLGDLYKTQVWQLAEALGVPKQLIDKKPSADLWEGQTDEGEFGFTYKKADHLLYFMIDERRSMTELKEMGFEPELVERVKNMVMKGQFKRRLPLIAKVSNRTVNVDFRYPRDWGI
ncbi:MAG: NAD+ synthase [Bacteroidetes bacterium]|nr:NAD+ synthase [Bacteroidota bacterium]